MKNNELLNNLKESFSRKNLFEKIVSLLIAILIWVFVNNNKIGDIEYKIPVKLNNLSTQHIISEQQKKFITVVYKGNREELNAINLKLVTARVDLSKPVLGKLSDYQIELNTSEIPESIEIYPIEKSILIKIEDKISKNVNVVPIYEGSLENGYFMGNISISPAKIKIEGPESIISEITKIETDTIEISNATETIEKSVALKIFENKKIQIITEKKEVNLKIPIYEAQNVSRVEMPIKFINFPENISVTAENEKLQIYIRILSNEYSFNDEENFINIDYEKIDKAMLKYDKNETAKIKYNVDLPNEKDDTYKIISVMPSTIDLTLKRGSE